jgi:hypothetical protein
VRPRRITTSLRISADVWAQLQDLAHASGRHTRNALAEEYIAQGIARAKGKRKPRPPTPVDLALQGEGCGATIPPPASITESGNA